MSFSRFVAIKLIDSRNFYNPSLRVLIEFLLSHKSPYESVHKSSYENGLIAVYNSVWGPLEVRNSKCFSKKVHGEGL